MSCSLYFLFSASFYFFFFLGFSFAPAFCPEDLNDKFFFTDITKELKGKLTAYLTSSYILLCDWFLQQSCGGCRFSDDLIKHKRTVFFIQTSMLRGRLAALRLKAQTFYKTYILTHPSSAWSHPNRYFLGRSIRQSQCSNSFPMCVYWQLWYKLISSRDDARQWTWSLKIPMSVLKGFLFHLPDRKMNFGDNFHSVWTAHKA